MAAIDHGRTARALRRSGLFDEAWYLQRYSDVANAKFDPIVHYLLHGAREGRDPSGAFDSLWYLETNPDVARSGVNPLHHYITLGRQEGRRATPGQAWSQAAPRKRAASPSAAVRRGTVDSLLSHRLFAAVDQAALARLLELCDPALAEILDRNLDAWMAITARQDSTAGPIDLLVSHNEINNSHGTGILLQRLFAAAPNLITLRPRSSYDGKDLIGFANLWLCQRPLSRLQLHRLFAFLLSGLTVRSVTCVPYEDIDLRAALAIAEILDAPLVVYVMDDNTLIGRGIDPQTMQRAVDRARLRLVISTEMREAYEARFRQRFHVLPPLVSDYLIGRAGAVDRQGDHTAVIVGNIWRQRWLDNLARVISEAQLPVRWYANMTSAPWIRVDEAALAAQGIVVEPPLPEAALVEAVATAPFCVVPTTDGDDEPGALAIARFSLPSRIPLLLASCHMPMLVVGDPDSAAARFVRRFDLGLSCGYAPAELRRCIAQLVDPQCQARFRANARTLASRFSDAGMFDWFIASLAQGSAVDRRFDSFLATQPGDPAVHIEDPLPPGVEPDLAASHRALGRLARRGFRPDYVIDAGASNGIWSRSMAGLFPDARFLLVEPLLQRHESGARDHVTSHPGFQVIEQALIDNPGSLELQLSGDHSNSSAVLPCRANTSECLPAPATTLDSLAEEFALTGRGLLKLDVQRAEHLALAGGERLLRDGIDAICIALTLRPEHPDGLSFLQLCALLDRAGFDYEDDAGELRSPVDGRLAQKEVLFIRHGLELAR